jgi:hypothetical protein
VEYSLRGIPKILIIMTIWEVEFTNEFEEWWNSLSETEQDDIDTVVRVLERQGPLLKEPLSKRIETSRHYPDMKELRITSTGGDRLRTFYVLDPRRTAILLIGGNKTGQWEEFYYEYIPIADALYDEHLKTIGKGER